MSVSKEQLAHKHTKADTMNKAGVVRAQSPPNARRIYFALLPVIALKLSPT